MADSLPDVLKLVELLIQKLSTQRGGVLTQCVRSSLLSLRKLCELGDFDPRAIFKIFLENFYTSSGDPGVLSAVYEFMGLFGEVRKGISRLHSDMC